MSAILPRLRAVLARGPRVAPAKAAAPVAMTPAEARAVLARFAEALTTAEDSREKADKADADLRAASALKLEDAYLAGETLPDIPQLRLDAENHRLRCRAALAAASSLVAKARRASAVLELLRAGAVSAKRQREEERIAGALAGAGFTSPAVLQSAFAESPVLADLRDMERRQPPLRISAIVGEGGKLALRPWRTAALPPSFARYGLAPRDEWQPKALAAEVRSFLALCDDAPA